jgi:hypothetical protein
MRNWADSTSEEEEEDVTITTAATLITTANSSDNDASDRDSEKKNKKKSIGRPTPKTGPMITRFFKPAPLTERKLPPYGLEQHQQDIEWTEEWTTAFSTPYKKDSGTHEAMSTLSDKILDGIGIFTRQLRLEIQEELSTERVGCPPGLELAKAMSKLILHRFNEPSKIDNDHLGYLLGYDGIWTENLLRDRSSTQLQNAVKEEWRYFNKKAQTYVRDTIDDINALAIRYYESYTDPTQYADLRSSVYGNQGSRRTSGKNIASRLIYILTTIPTARNMSRNQ